MPLPVIAATVAAVIIIIQMLLMGLAGAHRARTGIGAGDSNDDGVDQDLVRKVRRHGNLAENSALFIVTLALAELIGASADVLMAFGALFIFARLSHILAFSSLSGSHGGGGSKIFVRARMIGAFGTLLSSLGLGAYLLYLIYLLCMA